MIIDLKKAKHNFDIQKWRAINERNLEWCLTFDEWLNIWIESGHYYERGIKKGQYVMSRNNDIGSYSKENVFIQLSSDNIKQAHCNSNAEAANKKRSISMQGKNIGKIRTEEFKNNLRKPKNPESVKKMIETRRLKNLNKVKEE